VVLFFIYYTETLRLRETTKLTKAMALVIDGFQDNQACRGQIHILYLPNFRIDLYWWTEEK
jgi:hypothetical protein